jgi:diguanylate cyclase (GGDEF)-like protein
VRDVRGLSPQQAAHSLPVRLTGLVTVPSTYKSSFFFMDETGGLSIDRLHDSTPIEPGDRVEVTGVSAPGQFAPLVNADSVRVIGKGPLAPARLYEWNELAGGRADSQWISLRGAVRAASVQTIWDHPVLVLDFDTGVGSPIEVQVRRFPQSGWERLAGSIVQIHGVCGTIFNDRRQFVGLRLFVSSLDRVEVEKAAPADPFDTPLVSLDQLLLFNGERGSIQRIRIRGVVTYWQDGQGFFLQNERRGVFVRGTQFAPVAAGSVLEVVGYLAPGHFSPALEDAVYRQVGSSDAVAPVAGTAPQMVAVNQVGFLAAPYDSLLVQLQGRVVEEAPGTTEDELILQDGGTFYSAHLPRSGLHYRTYRPGTVLLLTGVCVTRFDEAHHFEVLLRSPADIRVLKTAPWWNAEHAGWVFSGGLLAILSVIGARAFLRRNRQLRTLTVTDPLTGLYNRRGFLELAAHDWEVALRRGSALLILYIDLDRFKEINDRFGHQSGDQALMAVADLLRGCFRNADVVARLGGDEFVVACQAASDSPATIEDRLETAVRRRNQVNSSGFQISLSVGTLVCGSMHASLSIEDLIARADALMYERKRSRQGAGIAGSSVA